MAAKPNGNSTQSSQWDLVLTRIFDAPRELVWKVWTDPSHLAQWWGPKGFTNPRCEWNPKPKGGIRIDMRAPDGVVYPMNGTFREIVKPERIVFISSALDENGNSMFDILNTVTFADEGAKTALTLQVRVLTTTARAPQHLKGMETGWNQSLDRLFDYLAQRLPQNGVAVLVGDREISATRIYDAPRELVWKLWTDPKHIVQWWGPNGFTTTVLEMDVRPQGVWRFIMHGPDGRDYKNRIVYLEVKKPERLVYKHSPERDSEPVNFEVTVDFSDKGGKTQIDMRMIFPSAAERDFVVKKHGAVEGLTQTLGRLAGYAGKTSLEILEEK